MYSKGISWIDDCRIPFVDDESLTRDFKVGGNTLGAGQYGLNDGRKTKPTNKLEGTLWENTQGRFPANILVSDDMLNDGKKHGNLFNTNRNKDVDGGTGNSLVRAHKQGESNGVFDNGISSSRFYDIDKWFEKLLND
jgi:hypothetical protein